MEFDGTAHHVEDVGRIILQVQEELRSVRSSMADQGNLAQIDSIIQQAETDLRAKAEVVLNSLVNNTVRTLPLVGEGAKPNRSRVSRSLDDSNSIASIREKLDQARQMEMLLDPTNQFSREYLAQRYGLPLSTENSIPTPPLPTAAPKGGKIAKPNIATNNTLLSKENRLDPQAPIPELTEADMKQGIMNLQTRGLIMRGSDLTHAFTEGVAVMTNAPAKIHDAQRKRQEMKQAHTYINPNHFNTSSLKFDMQPPRPRQTQQYAQAQPAAGRVSTQNLELDPSASTLKPPSPPLDPGQLASKRAEQDKQQQAELRVSVDKIRGYNELLDTYSLHQFLIRHGKTLDTTPEFISFQRKNMDMWGSIAGVIGSLEALLTKYSVPMAYIDGQAVVRLAADELQVNPSVEQLLGCIANFDQVSQLLQVAGQRFKGENGKTAATVCIQSNFRMHQRREEFTKRLQGNEAAEKVQGHWRGHQQRKLAIALLAQHRQENEEAWSGLVSGFRTNWDTLKTKRRVAIHIPSMSYEEHQRMSCTHFSVRQNMQIAARLCALADPSVDVIYVCPYELTDDVKGYYQKLLQIGGISDPGSRFKIIVPENAPLFPSHFSLSSMLLYSPIALKKLRRFITGKASYIIPGVVGPEDRLLSLLLKSPVMGAAPDVAQLYSTKSGAKRIFSTADVNMPIGAHDVYDMDELQAALVKLIATNLDVERWVVRIDDDFNGDGVAYLDVSDLHCVTELRRERLRLSGTDGEYWARPEVQEAARAKLEAELEHSLARKMNLRKVGKYTSWFAFERAFLRVGGVVEAAPSDIRGYPSMNVFIEPTGNVHAVSTHEKMCPAPHLAVGSLFPQNSVPFNALLGASKAVGRTLFAHGVIGYVTIHFTAFWDSFHSSMRIWATDLFLSLTNTAASFVMFNFVMGGRFDGETGKYELPEGSTSTEGGEEETTSEAQAAPAPQRCYAVHEYIYHPNLAQMQYSTFFNLCRLQGVSFDLRERLGTCFILVDSLAGGVLGLLSAGQSHYDALRLMSQTFEFIQEQVGTRSVQGEFDDEKGNFQDICPVVRSYTKQAQKEREKVLQKKRAERSDI